MCDQISGHCCPDELTHKIKHDRDQELLYWQSKNKGKSSCGLSSSIACHLSDSAILSIDPLFNLEVLLKHIYFRICKDTLKKGNQILYPNLHNLKITSLFQITWFKTSLSVKSVLLTFPVYFPVLILLLFFSTLSFLEAVESIPINYSSFYSSSQWVFFNILLLTSC